MIKKQQKQKLQTPTKRNNKHDTTDLTFLEHIYELRSRLFWVVAIIILASAVGFQFKDLLIAVVMDPLHGQKLVYLTPGGGFGFIFSLAIYFGVLVAIPVIVYHIYRFLQPLLKETSRKLVATFMLLSCLLAAAGAAFGYFVTIPAALDFLATFAGDAVVPNLTAESYLNFVVAYVLGLAALFQLPLLLFLFDHVKKFPPGSLLASQRYVIIGATIAAAIITPTPDAINMAIVAIPIVAIYQLGVIAVSIRHKSISRREKKVLKQQAHADALGTPAKPITSVLRQIGKQSVAAHSINEQKAVSTIESVKRPSGTRSMDGVIRQRPIQPIVVPQRSSEKPLTVTGKPQSNRPVRSLDGFGVMRNPVHS